MVIYSYKDLIVWQKAIKLVVVVYEITEKFPSSELYGLVSQMRRSSVSIPSNIAEGRMRGSRKEFAHFLLNAYASGAELETQIEIAKRLPKLNKFDYLVLEQLLNEIMKMLNSIIGKLKANSQ
ncbi:MAG: four helix bundle protein [bacterium]